LWSEGNNISNNSNWGVFLRGRSHRWMQDTTVNHNGQQGVFVLEGSFLCTCGGEVMENGNIGIHIGAFSHAVSDPETNVSGNPEDQIQADPYSAFCRTCIND
jgi:hypothetical protein